jgi:retinol-binding protein 3
MRFIRLKVALSIALCVLTLSTGARAGDAWNRDDGQEVVAALASAIERTYVDAGRAAEIAAELRSNLAAGHYDAAGSPDELAGVLTRELQQHDLHFSVGWSPPDGGPPMGGHSPEEERRWAVYSRLQNSGFRRLEVLPGNVGYLDLRMFDGTPRAHEVAASAMSFLADSDAVILDLRQNGGGEPAMVQRLISYFFGPVPVHYNSLVWRDGHEDRFSTLAEVAGRRMPEIPLYVLTSARTGSAAEGFSYAVQALGRALVIGERSAGAANPGESVPIARGFHAFISTGKAVNAVTGGNWEGTGVVPDVAVPATTAFDVAYAQALRGILAAEPPEPAATSARWALQTAEAHVHPVSLASAALDEYPGAYGDRRIRRDGEHLTYQRGRRSELEMVPLGGDRFLVETKEGFRLTFERDERGRILRLLDEWVDGHVEVNRRES